MHGATFCATVISTIQRAGEDASIGLGLVRQFARIFPFIFLIDTGHASNSPHFIRIDMRLPAASCSLIHINTRP